MKFQRQSVAGAMFQIAAIVCIRLNVAEDNLRNKPIGRSEDPGTLCRIPGKLLRTQPAEVISLRFSAVLARRAAIRIAQ
jgi:hypothetical protein